MDDIIANSLKELAFLVFRHTAGPFDFTRKMNALNHSWLKARDYKQAPVKPIRVRVIPKVSTLDLILGQGSTV